MEMCLTGQAISAQEARDFGMVSQVVAHDKLMEVALTMATKIANLSKV
jgi:enoyl-CoA hydratase/carnithine racemase